MNLSETAEVLQAMARLTERGRAMALATIVSVSGSTYRRPGARLLVPDDGEVVGNLSGGCLEGEVTEVAREVIRSGEPRLQMYDLTADDEVVWGWGLGCNGAIEVFIEPAERAAQTAGTLSSAIATQTRLAMATVIEGGRGAAPGRRAVVSDSGEQQASTGDPRLDETALGLCISHLGSGDTGIETVALGDERLRLFVEVIEPPLRLLVCGAGHDAIPLVRQAAGLGWRVEVIDDRAALLDRHRFEGAAGFLEVAPAAAAERARPDARTYVVVMSHNYLRDRDYLRSFLSSDAAYVGMLGPAARLERLLGDLRADGHEPTATQLERVHGPAGLDLGGEGPEEIATALVAEILARRAGRGGGPLRDRSGPIHERSQPVPT